MQIGTFGEEFGKTQLHMPLCFALTIPVLRIYSKICIFKQHENTYVQLFIVALQNIVSNLNAKTLENS